MCFAILQNVNLDCQSMGVVPYSDNEPGTPSPDFVVLPVNTRNLERLAELRDFGGDFRGLTWKNGLERVKTFLWFYD